MTEVFDAEPDHDTRHELRDLLLALTERHEPLV
jgi:hypothetical protein